MTSSNNIKTSSEKKNPPPLTPDEYESLFREWIEKISHTREFNHALSILLPEIVEQVIKPWTGNHHVKQVVVRFINSMAKKSFDRSSKNIDQRGLMEIIKDPVELSTLVAAVPGIVDQLTELIAQLSKTVESLPVNDQERLIQNLIEGFNFKRNGEIFNRFICILNEIHASNPAFITNLFGSNITKWLEKVDFGELSEAVDYFAQDIETLSNQTLVAFFQFPGKLILLMSFLPISINLISKILHDTLKHFNTMAPDLACDVALSFLNEINGKTVAELVNQFNELVRKINTGSALLGEPGAPQFPHSISKLFESFMQAIDGDLLLKTKTGYFEIKDNAMKAYIDQLSKYHEEVLATYTFSTSGMNYRNELRLKILSIFDNISDEQLGDVIEKGFNNFNAQDYADVINYFFSFMNRILELKPQLLTALIQDFFNSLDIDEIENTVTGVLDLIGDEAKPLMKAVLPPIIEKVKEMIQ